MNEDKSFIYLGCSLLICAMIFWELKTGVVKLSLGRSGGLHMIHVVKATHPKLFWGLITGELMAAVILMYKGLHRSDS